MVNEMMQKRYTKSEREFLYKNSLSQVEEFLKKRNKRYLKCPLSIKIVGDKEKYDRRFSDDMNCAMYYVSEWGRKLPDNKILLNYGFSSIIDCAVKLYNVDKKELEENLNKLAVEATKNQKYSFYVIQPYIIDGDKKHYFKKIIVKALDNERLDRRFNLIDEIKKYFVYDFSADILSKYKTLKEARENLENLNYNKIDINFIKNIKDNFNLKAKKYKGRTEYYGLKDVLNNFLLLIFNKKYFKINEELDKC